MGGLGPGPEPLTLDLLAQLDDESFAALMCVIRHQRSGESRIWDQDNGCGS